MEREIGIHLSISGGVHTALIRAAKLGINAVQIFLKNSNRWEAKPFSEKDMALFFQERKKIPGIKIYAHAGYLINLAGEGEKLEKSINAMEDECRRASALGIDTVVVHPGSHLSRGIDFGIRRAAESLDTVFSRLGDNTVAVLLETTAGQGSSIGHTFEQLQSIIEKSVNRNRLGICLDTCHLFASGYDISEKHSCERILHKGFSVFGPDAVKLIHLNDSKRECGSRVDRHEHIGDGKIGNTGFRFFLNHTILNTVPIILETPKFNKDEADIMNLERVKKLITK